jgi:hypothetical protein
VDPTGLVSGQPCWEKEIKLTKIATCKAKVVRSSGPCPADVLADICASLQQKIAQEGYAMLYPAICPKGEKCSNMTSQSSVVLQSNQKLTVQGCKGWGIAKICCTVELEISGTFTGDGKIGCCCQ